MIIWTEKTRSVPKYYCWKCNDIQQMQILSTQDISLAYITCQKAQHNNCNSKTSVRLCSHEWHPIPRTHGRAMGCISKGFQRKMTAIYRESTVYCNFSCILYIQKLCTRIVFYCGLVRLDTWRYGTEMSSGTRAFLNGFPSLTAVDTGFNVSFGVNLNERMKK